VDAFVTTQAFAGANGEGIGVGLVTVVGLGVRAAVGFGARPGASGEREAGAVAASVRPGVGELSSVETGIPVDGGDGGATSPDWLGTVRTPSEAVGGAAPHPAMRSDAANSTSVRGIAVLLGLARSSVPHAPNQTIDAARCYARGVDGSRRTFASLGLCFVRTLPSPGSFMAFVE
jgi:hypothetical protein